MKIQDAKLGDVLVDAEGDIWVMVLAARKITGPYSHESDECASGSTLMRLDEDLRCFPFTRLVPEKETP